MFASLTTLDEFPECLKEIFEGKNSSCDKCRRDGANLIKNLLGEKPMQDISHPAHYQSYGGLEAIDVIESFNLNFNLGNVIKYVLRSGKKDDDVKDLSKALWYLRREIKNLEMDEEEDE